MIRTHQLGQLIVATPVGEIRLGEEHTRIRDQLRNLLDTGQRKLLIDLSRVTYMDSSGVGLLLEIKVHAMNVQGDLRLCNVSPEVSQILSRLMLHTILTAYTSEDAALAEWGRP